MSKKSRLLYVYKFLKENSDEEHQVTINDITESLLAEGINVSRRTIPGNIDELLEFGIDIIKTKSTQNKYFIGNRHFELPEIKLLLDAVYSSKIITPKKSENLANKIKEFTSLHQRVEFAEEFHIAEMIKPLHVVTVTVRCLQ